jgi:hypothetical protein
MQPCAFIISYSNMKLLKTPNNLTTRISLLQLLKIETIAHGYVGMAHSCLGPNQIKYQGKLA